MTTNADRSRKPYTFLKERASGGRTVFVLYDKDGRAVGEALTEATAMECCLTSVMDDMAESPNATARTVSDGDRRPGRRRDQTSVTPAQLKAVMDEYRQNIAETQRTFLRTLLNGLKAGARPAGMSDDDIRKAIQRLELELRLGVLQGAVDRREKWAAVESQNLDLRGK